MRTKIDLELEIKRLKQEIRKVSAGFGDHELRFKERFDLENRLQLAQAKLRQVNNL